MGKFRTYARRGTETAPPVPLAAPPIPILYVPEDDVLQLAQGADDTGGTIQLQRQDNDLGYWHDFDTAAWEDSHVWGWVFQLVGYRYRAVEIGNGTTYAGASPWSITLDLR
jgi:hypothetical protein